MQSGRAACARHVALMRDAMPRRHATSHSSSGFVPARSAGVPNKLGRIVPPPPIDLLGPQHGIGVVPFKRNGVRVHRGQRVTSPTFRAALASGLARWQHPGITLDVKGAPTWAPPASCSFATRRVERDRDRASGWAFTFAPGATWRSRSVSR